MKQQVAAEVVSNISDFSEEHVARFLDTTAYGVIGTRADGAIVIAGQDDHGWAFEDYVAPRLASALMFARRVYITHSTGEVRSR
jgi:hypothetical protein